ncbi:tail fiber protein [Vibrio harveyi]|uniref:tail fiber protein n=1 Tax=Vibrio harveyi TaxID=669 RepID=UPI003BB4CCC6
MAKRIVTPFAQNGDRNAVSDNTQASGEVSYNQGYPVQYEKDLITDPDARSINRERFNQILHDITANIQEWQNKLFPEYVPPSDNGGNPVPYDKGMIVIFNNTPRISLINSNISKPDDNSKWDNAFPLPVALGGTGADNASDARNNLGISGGKSDGNPIGTYQLIDNFGSTPSGYLYCGGTAVSRATYSELFAKIGVKYGAGDGSTTFNLPPQDLLPKASYGHRFSQGYNKGERVAGIAINSKTKDVYVIGKPAGAQDWDVFKQTGGVGPWVSQGYNVGRQPLDIAINESNGDLWVADSFLATEVYKKSGGGSIWEAQHYSRDGGKYAFSIAVNQANGDVWVTDQNAVEVFSLAAGASNWVSQGYNTANDGDRIVPTGIDIDHLTGDIYVSDKNQGRISIKRGGSGAWEEDDSGVKDSAGVYIAVNPKNKDIFIIRNAASPLYVKTNGTADLLEIQGVDSNLNAAGLDVDHLTGDVYFSGNQNLPKSAQVYRFYGVPQWFVKAKKA